MSRVSGQVLFWSNVMKLKVHFPDSVQVQHSIVAKLEKSQDSEIFSCHSPRQRRWPEAGSTGDGNHVVGRRRERAQPRRRRRRRLQADPGSQVRPVRLRRRDGLAAAFFTAPRPDLVHEVLALRTTLGHRWTSKLFNMGISRPLFRIYFFLFHLNFTLVNDRKQERRRKSIHCCYLKNSDTQWEQFDSTVSSFYSRSLDSNSCVATGCHRANSASWQC